MSRSKPIESAASPATLEYAKTQEPCPLPWQSEVWDRLAGLVAENRLPHALLLEGDPGTGRGLFAAAFARLLLCHEPAGGVHCRQCKACRLAASGVHADLLTVHPLEEGKAIGIAAVREAIAFASRTASIGTRKVLLFSPAEALTTAAFNAFLKCLEEPAPDTAILLVFARGYPLPATIRSRCQRWQLPAPVADEAQRWLLGECAARAEMSELISAEDALALSDNRPLQALAMLDGSGPEGSHVFAAALGLMGQGNRQAVDTLERAAGDVSVTVLLELLTRHVQSWLRNESVEGLRSARGRSAFSALSRLAELRSALQQGSNPSEDLLRFSALKACARLWAE